MFVADTHSFLWFLTNDERLGSEAKEIFRLCDSVEETIAIPSIALLECLYVCERKKVSVEFKEILARISGSFNYLIYPLDEEVVFECSKILKIKDPHDRIIVATAKLLNAPVITKDEEIKNSGTAEIVW